MKQDDVFELKQNVDELQEAVLDANDQDNKEDDDADVQRVAEVVLGFKDSEDIDDEEMKDDSNVGGVITTATSEPLD